MSNKGSTRRPALSQFWALILILLIVGWATSACSDKQKSESNKPLIKLAANYWESSELNAAVAKIILEEEMGYPVEIVLIDENEQWQMLANGDLHACLEVWASGHAEPFQKYIEQDQTVEYGGLLGPMGKIGWYIPDYLLQQHPELVTWEGLKDPQNAALFATAETGNKGRFLAGDPGWVQYDEDIIRNLGLDLQVVRLGSEEALLDALGAAYDKQEPILFYFWTPHWVHMLYNLVPVTLPPYSEECYAQAQTGGVDCDYPPDELYKIFWAGLKNYAPDAYQFLKAFNYTNVDQTVLMAMVQVDGKTAEEAARAWVEENKSVWEPWIP